MTGRNLASLGCRLLALSHLWSAFTALEEMAGVVFPYGGPHWDSLRFFLPDPLWMLGLLVPMLASLLLWTLSDRLARSVVPESQERKEHSGDFVLKGSRLMLSCVGLVVLFHAVVDFVHYAKFRYMLHGTGLEVATTSDAPMLAVGLGKLVIGCFLLFGRAGLSGLIFRLRGFQPS